MGRYTLLLVLAAVAAGSYLSFTALRTRTETGDRRAGSQAAVLARQLAESGQAIALSAITTDRGFDGTGGVFVSDRPHNGGVIRFHEYADLPAPGDHQRVQIKVQGTYGGATHQLTSVYDYDPMDFPGPIWLDVPYATGSVDKKATIGGTGAMTRPQIDKTKNKDLGLSGDGLTFDDLEDQFAKAKAPVPDWVSGGGKARTADLKNDGSSADDLYYQITNEASAAKGDRIYAGARTLSGTVGGRSEITWVKGDVSVPGSARGSGALVVEGDLVVSGTLDWDGIVLVRTTEEHVTVDLGANTTITGGLVVSQEAFPPGGHVDLTVFRNPAGASAGSWGPAWGRREAGPGALRGSSWDLSQPYPWFEHTHQFDQPKGAAASDADRRAGRVRFVDAGDPHGAYAALAELTRELGSTPVQVEFAHLKGAHGHAVYALGVQGRDRADGTVLQGFGGTSMEGPSAHRSAAFPAQDLRRLVVHPRSRRSLRKLWDGPGACPGDEWPYCVGESGDRRDALTVRVVDAASGKAYYEGVIYWHMQMGDEKDEYQADKAAWEAGVASGKRPFGTTFRMDRGSEVTYSGAPITAFADRLGFKGDEVIHVSTESDLTEAVEGRALAAADAASRADAIRAASDERGRVLMCNSKRDGAKLVEADKVEDHEAHGCTVGACPGTAPPPTGAVTTHPVPPTSTPPAAAPGPSGDWRRNSSRYPTQRCRGGWEWDDGQWECD